MLFEVNSSTHVLSEKIKNVKKLYLESYWVETAHSHVPLTLKLSIGDGMVTLDGDRTQHPTLFLSNKCFENCSIYWNITDSEIQKIGVSMHPPEWYTGEWAPPTQFILKFRAELRPPLVKQVPNLFKKLIQSENFLWNCVIGSCLLIVIIMILRKQASPA